MHITRFIISSLGTEKSIRKILYSLFIAYIRFFSFKIINIVIEQADNTSVSRFKLISTLSSNNLHALAKS